MDGEISTDEVKELLEADADVRIVDIRDERNFEHSHIPGSENIPFHELTERIEELEDDDHIVTVCPHGKASVQAAQLIGSYEGTADARVESMAGGLDKYGMKFGLVREAEDEDEPAGRESPF
ncbi:rhodanese-like domain-containing protein [Natrinema longum]|uniref:Rhodanese-like domain-containing protein n=1 Tax=Natrinema longum TaxID=370324 RepID=A0A8A2U648_9EURY|nr:rhodanese-like domain-containing protein [Natrinema longum]MBZ6494487.1 rhodanese-like domain-containing protein [Natrinema longum]QSW84190.1 rhodanese-like domain-containing protein [Natrinema longum]